MKIINSTKNTTVCEQVELADSAWSRLVGLLGRDSLPDGHGLVITQCRSIHMFFMRFAIDVVFVDKDNKAIGIVKRIRPFGHSPYYFRASAAIELPAGGIDKSRTEKGDVLAFV